MKTIILTIGLLFSYCCKAQFKELYNGSPVSTTQYFVDSIKACLPDYAYQGFDSATEYDHKIFAFHFTNSKNNEVVFQYSKCYKKTAQQVTQVLCNVKIHGPLSELHEIWKRYFSPNSEKENINKKGGDAIPYDDEHRLLFRPLEKDLWSIFLY